MDHVTELTAWRLVACLLTPQEELQLPSLPIRLHLSLQPPRRSNWRNPMRPTLILLVAASLCWGQTLHVTADLLSRQTTAAMFGKLPVRYSAAAVSVCNLTGDPQTVALALAAQQIALPKSIVMLPGPAALSVVAAAQGSSAWGTAARIGTIVVGGAAIAASLSSLSATVKGVLTDTALDGSKSRIVLTTTGLDLGACPTVSAVPAPRPVAAPPAGSCCPAAPACPTWYGPFCPFLLRMQRALSIGLPTPVTVQPDMPTVPAMPRRQRWPRDGRLG